MMALLTIWQVVMQCLCLIGSDDDGDMMISCGQEGKNTSGQMFLQRARTRNAEQDQINKTRIDNHDSR